MILENGDFFVINDEPHVELLPNGMKLFKPGDFEGMVFEAVRVEGDQVLAKVLERDTNPDDKDILLSLWIKRYNIDIVSKDYATLFKNSRKPDIMNMLLAAGEGIDSSPEDGFEPPDFDDGSDFDAGGVFE